MTKNVIDEKSLRIVFYIRIRIKNIPLSNIMVNRSNTKKNKKKYEKLKDERYKKRI